MCWKRLKGLYVLAPLLKVVESGWTPDGKIGGGKEAVVQLSRNAAIAKDAKLLKQRKLHASGDYAEGNRAVVLVSALSTSAVVFLCGTAMLVLVVWRWRGTATKRCNTNGANEESTDGCEAFDASTSYIFDEANNVVESNPEQMHGSWRSMQATQGRKNIAELQDPAECLQDSAAVGDAPWVHSSPRQHEPYPSNATSEASASITEEYEERPWAWLSAAHDFLFDELPETRATPQDVMLLPEPTPSEPMSTQGPRRMKAIGRALHFADDPDIREYDPLEAVLGEAPCKGQLRNTASTETFGAETAAEEADEPHDECPPRTSVATPFVSRFALRVANAAKQAGAWEPSRNTQTMAMSPRASKFALSIAMARLPAADDVQPASPTFQPSVMTRCQL